MSGGAEADPSPPTPAPRDARERVLDCAARLLEESGLEGLTIRRLSAACGLTPPALYTLFGDKAGILEALVQRSFVQLSQAVGSIESSGVPRDDARRAYLEIARYGCEHPHHFRLLEARLPASTPTGPSLEVWREQMPTPLFETSGPDALDPQLMRQIFWGLLHGLVTLPPLRLDVGWREDLAGYAFDALLDGLLVAQRAEGASGD